MPELPDVEGFRRRFQRLARGRTVARVDIEARPRAMLAPPLAIRAALRGRRLGETRRVGKWMFARAGPEAWLVLHFGMTGDVVEVGGDDPPYARLVIRFRGGGGVAFTDPRRFGRIGLASSPEEFARERGLGPDAMEVSERAFLRRAEGHRAGAKALLLDQRAIAGVGNLWADEILWQARIHPATRVEDLDAADRRRLFRVMRKALRRAMQKPGDNDALPRSWLLPHRSRGARCPRCQAQLARGTIAGRTTYWCPEEQPRVEL